MTLGCYFKPVEQSLHSVLIYLLTFVGVTSRSLKLFDLSFNELMYDGSVVLSAFLFPTNLSAFLLKNSLSFLGSSLYFFLETCVFLVDNLFHLVPNCSEFFP